MRLLHKRTSGKTAPGQPFARRRLTDVLLLLIQGLLTLVLVGVCGVGSASAAAGHLMTGPQVRQVLVNPQGAQLRQLIREGRLAPTVRVVDSLPPTVVEQFPLVPSGVKQAFPNAVGLVTIVRGNRDNNVSDTITVDVQNMPPNITFTISSFSLPTSHLVTLSTWPI